MIERYSIGTSATQLALRFEVEEPSAFQARYNAAPAQLLPVIIPGTPRGFSFFYWGQPPGWTKNKTLAEKIINVRVEQIMERPVLKRNLMKNRCLVPSDGFYAWNKVEKKTLIPWRFARKDKSVFSMAGLWEEYEDEERNAFHTFTLLTVASTGLIAAISDRTPVILDQAQEKKWLDTGATEQEVMGLVVAGTTDLIDGFPVSPQLNSLSFDRPSLLLPVPAADQYGNLTLFD